MRLQLSNHSPKFIAIASVSKRASEWSNVQHSVVIQTVVKIE